MLKKLYLSCHLIVQFYVNILILKVHTDTGTDTTNLRVGAFEIEIELLMISGLFNSIGIKVYDDAFDFLLVILNKGIKRILEILEFPLRLIPKFMIQINFLLLLSKFLANLPGEILQFTHTIRMYSLHLYSQLFVIGGLFLVVLENKLF